MLWALSGCCIDSPQQYNVKNLDMFFFFISKPQYLSARMIIHTYINPYFFSFKTSVPPSCLLFSLWFFCESSSALQELSNDIQHDHTQKKHFPTLWGPGFKICHFRFSAVAEAVCTPTMATCVSFTSYCLMTKIKYSQQCSFDSGKQFPP